MSERFTSEELRTLGFWEKRRARETPPQVEAEEEVVKTIQTAPKEQPTTPEGAREEQKAPSWVYGASLGVRDGVEKIVPSLLRLTGLGIVVVAPLLLNAIFAGLGFVPPTLLSLPAFSVLGNLFHFPGFELVMPLGPMWTAAGFWGLMGALAMAELIPVAKKQIGGVFSKEGRERDKKRRLIEEGKVRPGDEEYDPELDTRLHEGGAGIKFAKRQIGGVWKLVWNPVTRILGPVAAAVVGFNFLTGNLTLPTIAESALWFAVPWLQTLGIALSPLIAILGISFLTWGFIYESTHSFAGTRKFFKGLFSPVTNYLNKENIVFSEVQVRREPDDIAPKKGKNATEKKSEPNAK